MKIRVESRVKREDERGMVEGQLIDKVKARGNEKDRKVTFKNRVHFDLKQENLVALPCSRAQRIKL